MKKLFVRGMIICTFLWVVVLFSIIWWCTEGNCTELTDALITKATGFKNGEIDRAYIYGNKKKGQVLCVWLKNGNVVTKTLSSSILKERKRDSIAWDREQNDDQEDEIDISELEKSYTDFKESCDIRGNNCSKDLFVEHMNEALNEDYWQGTDTGSQRRAKDLVDFRLKDIADGDFNLPDDEAMKYFTDFFALAKKHNVPRNELAYPIRQYVLWGQVNAKSNEVSAYIKSNLKGE
jgi:hypothetical protein